MKSIIIRQYGDPEVMKIEDVPIPEVGTSNVLVRVKAAGVNPLDTYFRQGSHANAPNPPFTPGKDAAGIVKKAGDRVQKVKEGDRVYLAGSITGTYSEYALCDEQQVWKLPNDTTFEQGAGIFVPYATAYRALVQKAKIKVGETVLVHGASGAVGIAIIQWAKKAGLKVMGTAGSERGKTLLKEQNVERVFDHSETNHLKRIKDATDGKGVEIIMEMLANVNLENDFEVLAKAGRIVVIGNRGSLKFNPRLIMEKDATVLGMLLFNASNEKLEEIHSKIYKGLDQGYLNPVIGKLFPLSEAPRAHHEVIEKKAYGKIVLIPDADWS